MTTRLRWTRTGSNFGEPTFTAYINGVVVERLHARRKVRGYRVHGQTHRTLREALAAAGRMKRSITANGLLRHRFHGTYSAVIGLMFGNADGARCALAYLGPGWKFSSAADATSLVWVGNKTELQACVAILARFGADPRKVDSLAKSVDYGEPFTITLPEAS